MSSQDELLSLLYFLNCPNYSLACFLAVSFILGAFVAKMLFPVLGKYNTCVNIGIFVFLSILYWGFQHPRRVRRWLRVVGVSKEE